MTRFSTLLFVMIFFGVELVGQNAFRISGIVKDSVSNESLINATVLIKPLNIGLITDANGAFTSELTPGTYYFEISFLGYQTLTKKVRLNRKQHFVFYLSEKSVKVSDVTISAEKPDKNIQSNKSGTLMLTSKEINQLPNLMGEPDIINALRLTPGVQGVGEGNPGLYVRGGDAGQNLIMLDQMVLYNPSHLLGFFPGFTADIINNVKIIKGAIPAQYGGKASSVIDISLKEGNSHKFSGSGSVGLLAADLTLETPINKGKGSLIISGRRTYLELLKKASEPFINSEDNIFSRTDYSFHDGSLKFTYKLSLKTRFYLTAFGSADSYFFIDNEFKVSNGMKWNNDAASARINHAFSDKLRGNIWGGFTRYNFSIDAKYDKYGFSLMSSIEDWNGNIDFIYLANEKLNFRFGLNAVHHILTPNKININVESVYFNNTNRYYSNEFSSFLQGDVKLNKKLSFTTGIRQTYFQHIGPFTHYERDAFGKLADSVVYITNELVKAYHTLDMNLSMVYLLTKESSIKSSFASTHQFIHLASVGTVSLPTDVWLPSTQFIKPQKVLQVTAGYFRNFLNNAVETSIEAYYKNLDHQIDFLNGVLDNFDNTRIENNIIEGKGKAYGIELFVKKQSGNTTGWLSYTLSRTLRKFNNFNDNKFYPAKYDRVHDFSLTVNHKLNERWNLSSSFIYATGNAMTMPAGRYVIQGNVANHYTAVNSFRMKAYHRLDVSANYQLKKTKRLESWINFSIYNVYNHANPYYIYFRVKGDIDAYTLSVKLRQISLFPILPSITWNFKF